MTKFFAIEGDAPLEANPYGIEGHISTSGEMAYLANEAYALAGLCSSCFEAFDSHRGLAALHSSIISLEQDKMTPTDVSLLRIAVESARTQLGLPQSVDSTSKVTLEAGIVETMREIWARVVSFLKDLWKKIVSYLGLADGNKKNLDKEAEAIKQEIKHDASITHVRGGAALPVQKLRKVTLSDAHNDSALKAAATHIAVKGVISYGHTQDVLRNFDTLTMSFDAGTRALLSAMDVFSAGVSPDLATIEQECTRIELLVQLFMPAESIKHLKNEQFFVEFGPLGGGRKLVLSIDKKAGELSFRTDFESEKERFTKVERITSDEQTKLLDLGTRVAADAKKTCDEMAESVEKLKDICVSIGRTAAHSRNVAQSMHDPEYANASANLAKLAGRLAFAVGYLATRLPVETSYVRRAIHSYVKYFQRNDVH